MALLGVLAPASAAAAGNPTPRPEPAGEQRSTSPTLAELQRRSARLQLQLFDAVTAYDLARAKSAQVNARARQVQRQAERAQEEASRLRADLGQFAARLYRSGGADETSMAVLTLPVQNDGGSAMHAVSALRRVGEAESQRVAQAVAAEQRARQLATMTARAARIRQAAAAQAAAARKAIEAKTAAVQAELASRLAALDTSRAVDWLQAGLTEMCYVRGGEQLSNAATIVAVGRARNLPERAWIIALATALQESGLRNISYGDRDSLGLFQQRPSAGWGTPRQLLDPVYAAGKFYERLVTVPGWDQLPLTVAAQAVQRSAFPDAYAKWETAARGLAATAGSACTATHRAGLTGVVGGRIVAAARSQLGVPYSWGGGGPAGPSRGFAQGADTVGFDCSSLAQYAYARVGIQLPRTTEAQINTGGRVPLQQLRAGDLLFFHMDQALGHVGIYDGHGGMIHAPRTGRSVEIVPDVLATPRWRNGFSAAVRPGSDPLRS